jgi:hypothetical protein
VSSYSWSRTDTRWYLAVRCEKCELPITFGLDHSEDAKESLPAAKLVLTCTVDNCRHRADYTTAAVLRFQKHPAVANETRSKNESGKNRELKG